MAILLGLERPTAGEVTVAATNFRHSRTASRQRNAPERERNPRDRSGWRGKWPTSSGRKVPEIAVGARHGPLPVKSTLAVATLLLASCSPSGGPPELHLTDAWVRESVPGQTATAAYLSIANVGGSGDRLVAVTAPVPAKASLHASRREDRISRMRPIKGGLEIQPGETLTLEPGGAHIMIENLAQPLHPGETLRLNLRFTRSGERTIEVPVQSARATGPAQQSR